MSSMALNSFDTPPRSSLGIYLKETHYELLRVERGRAEAPPFKILG